MKNKAENKPMYEQIYKCLVQRGLVVGQTIKENDAHCARVAAEEFNAMVKPSHISYMRGKYGLQNPDKPPTYQEINEAICEIISDADITIQRYDIYRVSRIENGRTEVKIYFGEEEAKANIRSPKDMIAIIHSQSFVALEINDTQMAELVSEKLGKSVKTKQITYWRKLNGVAASHVNHGGKREYVAIQEDTTALLENNHRWDTYRLSTEWVPDLTGGILSPTQRECCKKLGAIARKIKKGQGDVTALRASARKIAIDYNIALPPPPAVGGEDIEDFSSYCGGKKTKGGGKVSIQAGQFFAN